MNQIKKRAGALLLAATLFLGQLGAAVYAEEGPPGTAAGPCEHHTTHDDTCGYVEASQPCGYVCDACGIPDSGAEDLDFDPEPEPVPDPEQNANPPTQDGDPPPDDSNNNGYHDGDEAAFQAILGTHFNLVSGTVTRDDPASWNSLVEWDDSTPKRIVKLKLYDKGLQGALDVSKLTALTYLSCGFNRLTELDVSNLTALTEIICSNNHLTELDVGNLTSLTKLYCHTNWLTELNVSSLPKLTTLDCSTNQLSNLNVGNLPELTNLKCYRNALTNLDVSDLTKLTDLYCHDNQLPELNVSNLTALTGISCYNNPFQSVTPINGKTLTIGPPVGGEVEFKGITPDNRVTLTAKPNSGYAFQEWSGLPAEASGGSHQESIAFTLTEDVTVTAVFRPLLKSISLSSGTLTPAFDPAITNYTARVGNNVTSVIITAEALDIGFSVSGSGEKTLDVGANSFTIHVSNSTNTYPYTVTITRASPSRGSGSGGGVARSDRRIDTPSANKPLQPYQPVTADIDFEIRRSLLESTSNSIFILTRLLLMPRL